MKTYTIVVIPGDGIGNGETQAADLILAAIKAVTSRGYPLTPDIGGTATTREVGDAIVEQLRLLSK